VLGDDIVDIIYGEGLVGIRLESHNSSVLFKAVMLEPSKSKAKTAETDGAVFDLWAESLAVSGAQGCL
jgi:hypothetical protein